MSGLWIPARNTGAPLTPPISVGLLSLEKLGLEVHPEPKNLHCSAANAAMQHYVRSAAHDGL